MLFSSSTVYNIARGALVSMNSKIALCGLLTLAVMTPLSSQASGKFYINSSLATVDNVLENVGGARYRLDNQDWDQALYQGVLPTNAIPSFNLGTVGQLSGTEFAFVLEHSITQGFTFSLADNSRTTVTGWGDFGSVNSQDSKIEKTINGVGAADRSFNALYISAKNSRNASIDFSDMIFTGAGLTNGDLNSSFIPSSKIKTANAILTQSLFANVDLRNYDWTLTGKLRGLSSLAGRASGIDFDISINNIRVTEVPEPAFYQASALLMLGGVGLWRIRRKKTA